MKHLFILLLSVIIVSCKRNSTETVTDYFNALNNQDTSKITTLLDNDFKTTFEDTVLNKTAFNKFLADGFNFNQKFIIIKTTEKDSLIEVKVKYKQPLDSLFQISVLPEIDYKFYLENNKIYRIDSKSDDVSFDLHKKEYGGKYFGVLYYLMDNNLLDDKATKQNIKDYIIKYYTKFTSESKEVQTKYIKSSFLRGTYTCEKCIYKVIEFKGASTCLVLGFYATSYVVDENYIRIKTDKGDLLLKIIDENTLEGEGWAEGHYKKVK